MALLMLVEEYSRVSTLSGKREVLVMRFGEVPEGRKCQDVPEEEKRSFREDFGGVPEGRKCKDEEEVLKIEIFIVLFEARELSRFRIVHLEETMSSRRHLIFAAVPAEPPLTLKFFFGSRGL
ncbi:hypothetical protein Zmor_010747 [Zophobas morio]|uniref:Uncharacterized protein n=1 Tax=Zophobas morio TaxID=2755281 RepID=A0AA38IJH1_9CUCU|nr:hypothetical protein Zmor_010747 [Zophobas morio]